MTNTNNHIFLVGYLTGAYAQLRQLEDAVIRSRLLFPHSNEMQLELDRAQADIEKELESVVNDLYEIPLSN